MYKTGVRNIVSIIRRNENKFYIDKFKDEWLLFNRMQHKTKQYQMQEKSIKTIIDETRLEKFM